MQLRALPFLLAATAAAAPAQETLPDTAAATADTVADTVAPPPAAVPPALVLLGSDAEDRLRLDQLRGRRSPEGFLLRSASTLTPAPEGVRLVDPELRWVVNSDLPYSLNDGVLWAGRGGNLLFTAGVRGRLGPLRVTLAPQAAFQRNRSFQTIPYPDDAAPARDSHASPWYVGAASIDAPSRFGAGTFWRVTPGQSRAALDLGPAEVGGGWENEWWGPGIRNALVMSDNAEGFPHLFAGTREPLRTPVGAVEARWIVGMLSESDHFDFDGGGRRALSAVAVTLSPPGEPGLTLGAARVAFAAADGWGDLPGHVVDPFRLAVRRDTLSALDAGDDAVEAITSVFARWVMPESGFEAYAEWARTGPLPSPRQFLTDLRSGQGYTVGLQWAATPKAPATLRLQAEATNLEQTPSFTRGGALPFYASGAVPQGYTHRGQVLGAAIGPGASSQWLAADWIDPAWRVGGFFSRIRWEEDMFPDRAQFSIPTAHDVSVIGGVRGGVRLPFAEVDGELSLATRYNYLFQDQSRSMGDNVSVTVVNTTLVLAVRPRLGRW